MPFRLTHFRQTVDFLEFDRQKVKMLAQPARTVNASQLREILREWQRGLDFVSRLYPQSRPRDYEFEVRTTPTTCTIELNGWQWSVTQSGEDFNIDPHVEQDMPYDSLENFYSSVLAWLDG